MKKTVLALIAIPAFVCAVGACADGATKKAEAEAAPAPQTFLHEAAVGGLAEVELGKLAQQNASSAAVKDFASTMVNDHGKANQELESLAQKENVTLPTQLDAKHTALRDRLAKLNGAAFDRAYMTEMVKDHQKDVAEFRAESKSSTNADVKAFAVKTLPVLEGHLQMAKDVQQKL